MSTTTKRTETGNGHSYKMDGTKVDGVTTILGVLNKEALPKWAAGCVAEFVADDPDAIETLRSLGRKGMVKVGAR